MVSPLVSVVMSVYNTDEGQLKEAINSILNQTYSNFEFLIVNDGSTNNIDNVINTYKDSRIKYLINEKNIGLPASLNKGILNSNGIYIARMDSDDISMPKRLEKQVKILENHRDIGVLGTNAKLFGNKKGFFKFPTSHEQIKSDLLINSSMIHPSVMMRKSIIGDEPYDPTDKKAEDYNLWTKLIWKTKFANLSENLIKYRFHENQKSKSKDTEMESHLNKIRLPMLKKLNSNLSDEDLRILFDSSNLKLLSESDLKSLIILNDKLIKDNHKFDKSALKNTLAINLDRAIYIYAKENRTLPRKFLLPKTYKVNRFLFLKYIALVK